MKTLHLLPQSRSDRRRGFSLAELMVVIVIIGLLATLVVPSLIERLSFANVGKARADLTAIADAVDTFVIRNMGKHPEDLEVLVTPDENGYTFLGQRTIPKDPWGFEYQYEPPSGGERFRVYTYGADGQPGGEGKDKDFDNWSVKEGDSDE